MNHRPQTPTDWRRRFRSARPPKRVVLNAGFAGLAAGTTMYVGSPAVIADWINRIPAGETRSVARLRNELARAHDAQATCPTTTALFLRVVAEVALADLAAGQPPEAVIPFWRVVAPDSPVARRLSCDPTLIADLRAREAAAPG
jgi:hypothetical protein